MEARKCNYCGESIPLEKRADSKFCSNSCKANHWEENKGKKNVLEKIISEKQQEKIPEKPLEGLRGVIENTPKIDGTDVKEPSKTQENKLPTPTIIKKETQAYKEALAKKKRAEADYLRVQNILTECRLGLEKWQIKKEELVYKKPTNQSKIMNIDIMDLQKNSWDDLSEFINCSDQEKEIKEKITFFTDSKAKLEKMLPQVRKIVEEADQKLKSTRQYELSIQNSGLLTLNLLKGIEKKKLQEDIRQPEQIETKQEEEQITENPILIQSNSKLISSRELRELHYKCLNFQGKWKDFFGLPAVVFHLAVHGKPGEGKSTFCIQFADYLAKDFGNVVYISGEEGFSKTLRDKVVNNKIDNPHLFFADISSFEQIKNEIENNKFHFIFIDSLDTLRIDATKLRELREYYSQSAFITISQSTKDGKMRGSQEIIHDTDIAAKVENGIAITTKNRYHPRGTEFQVFPSSSKPTSKIINEPRNIM
jgi:hypothetical protein